MPTHGEDLFLTFRYLLIKSTVDTRKSVMDDTYLCTYNCTCRYLRTYTYPKYAYSAWLLQQPFFRVGRYIPTLYYSYVSLRGFYCNMNEWMNEPNKKIKKSSFFIFSALGLTELYYKMWWWEHKSIVLVVKNGRYFSFSNITYLLTYLQFESRKNSSMYLLKRLKLEVVLCPKKSFCFSCLGH